MGFKKISFILATGAVLTACQTDEADTSDVETEEVEEMEDTESEDLDTQEDEAALDDEVDEAVVADEDLQPVSDEELDSADNVVDLTQYEEFSNQDVFVPENYDAYLITDNPGNRVFIFSDDNQQAFKTIFIKNDNRLKVIDLINNELLMNDPI